MNAEDMSQVKEMLAEDFEQKADWRETVAAEHPEDERNELAARGMRDLAAYVRGLPDDDERLRRIAAALTSGDFDVGTLDMVLSRYGFGPGSHLGPPDASEFFTWYAQEWSRQLEIESAYRSDPDRIRRLIADDRSARDVVAIAHRREVVDLFRRFLDNAEFFDGQIPTGRGPEAVWQSFLEDNHWILSGSLSGQFFESWDADRLEQTVAGSSVGGGGRRVDALLRTAGRVQSMAFLEIKHHRTDLLGEEYRTGCWSPSRELCGGVVQVQDTVQRAIAEIGERLSQHAPDGSDIPDAFTYLLRPRSFLIIGNLNQLIGEAGGLNRAKYQSFELYRRHLQEPEIITFDELLARAEGIVEYTDP
jgi:hypothetical protein